MKKITIIGAGIGGLTTAIALQKKGFEVELFEKAQKISPVGAGLFLASNAMQIYSELGLREKIELAGHTVSELFITKPNLAKLTVMNLAYFENLYKVKNVAIHRYQLQDILIKALKPNTKIYFDYELDFLENKGEGYLLNFKNGSKIETEIVLGADGIHSKVRAHIFEENCIIRKAKQICWRAVVGYKLPENYQHKMVEIWGRGKRFGFSQISENTVYWFALVNEKMDTEVELLEHFTEFDSLIINLIKSAHKSKVHKDSIHDLQPISRWSKDGICLIGDAAHATTPNLGQGACQAIEDGYYLAKFLSEYKREEVFEKFERFRKQKVNKIVNTSWKLGKIAQTSNPIIQFVRNIIFSFTPTQYNLKQSDNIFKLKKMER